MLLFWAVWSSSDTSPRPSGAKLAGKLLDDEMVDLLHSYSLIFLLRAFPCRAKPFQLHTNIFIILS
jgi:hypothetical protein